MSKSIRIDNFVYNEDTNVITFDDAESVDVGSFTDGDTIYTSQGRFCIDAMICDFVTRKTPSQERQEYIMWRINVYRVKEGASYEFFNFRYVSYAPKEEDYECIETIDVYADNSTEERFDASRERYVEQISKLFAKYSTLLSV